MVDYRGSTVRAVLSHVLPRNAAGEPGGCEYRCYSVRLLCGYGTSRVDITERHFLPGYNHCTFMGTYTVLQL